MLIIQVKPQPVANLTTKVKGLLIHALEQITKYQLNSWLCWLLLITIQSTIVACGPASDGPHVVLYASADEYIVRQVIAQFTEQTGIKVDFLGDTEAQKTTGLVNRLIAESDNPQADVFWSSEVFMTIKLAEQDILDPHQSPATSDWPKRYKDKQNLWYGFASRARVIVYAPDRISADDLPQTWMELVQDRYKNRIVMADPRFGTTGGHLGAMKAYWNRIAEPAYYSAFLEGLAANNIRLLPSGNAGVVKAVASGEADLGMTDTDDVWAAQEQGLNVKLIYPRHASGMGDDGTGTLLIPNTVALIKGGANSVEAAKLIDFLLSEEVERMLANSTSHNIPVREKIASDFSQYQVPDPLKVSYKQAANMREVAVAQAMDWLTRKDKHTQSLEEDAP